MRFRGLFAVAAVALAVAGCGDDPPQAPPTQQPAQQPAEQPTAGGAQGEPAGADEPADGGEMVVVYEDATSPEANNGRALLQNYALLEALAEDVNDALKLPYDIALIAAECGEANAYWDPQEQSMTICYEDVDLSQQIFIEAGDDEPDGSALNAEIATFYHELGHMAIDVYDLPVTGREEDVADQLAAFVLLQPGEDGVPDEESIQAVKDFARTFGAYGQRRGEVGLEDFADVHSLSETRMFNLQCWIYGSDPEANTDLVATGELPEDRADGCEEEWVKLVRGWATLLEPYVK